jgi:hypothetical protein
MSIFIKAGLWTEKIKGFKGELNLSQLFSGGGNNSYSQTEALTGGTWIDGKPIYRKVISFTAPSTGNHTQVQVNHNLGIETYTRADITAVVDNGASFRTFIFPLGSLDPSNTTLALVNFGQTVTTDNSVIFEDVETSSTQLDFLLILEYTKI